MDDFLRIVNRLYEVLVANLTPIETWGFFLTSPDFAKERELRNRLGTVWICSLLDTLEAEERFLPEAAAEAKAKGYDSLAHNAAQLQNFCTLVGEVLNLFSREEQLLLQDLRNQWVHSYLANRHRDRISVKYANGGKLVKETLTHEAYHATIRPFFENGQSLEDTLTPIVARALNMSLRYWRAMGDVQRDRHIFYEALLSKKRFTIRV